MKILKRCVVREVEQTALISLKKHPNVFIPNTYIVDDKERLAMYQRLLSVQNRMALKKLQLECKDRYGPVPKRMASFFTAIDVQLSI